MYNVIFFKMKYVLNQNTPNKIEIKKTFKKTFKKNNGCGTAPGNLVWNKIIEFWSKQTVCASLWLFRQNVAVNIFVSFFFLPQIFRKEIRL